MSLATPRQVHGSVPHGTTDVDSPIKTGGVARTTNPTAVENGDRVNAFHDVVGRQVITVGQVRGLRSTAYVTLNTNTETTLLAAPAATFLDLIYIAFANTSSGAVNIDLRSETGGGIVQTYAVPANTTSGFILPGSGFPQNTAAATWTVDFNTADVSTTTVYVNALFDQNV